MTLALTKLTLSHFRSHKHSEIVCDARPIAIYGPNGAGKTNILEAVSLFSPGRGIRRASAQDMTRRPEAVGWKLKGILEAATGTQEIETWSDEGSARQVKINDKAAPQTRLGELCRVIWLIPAMDRLWIEGAEGRRRTFCLKNAPTLTSLEEKSNDSSLSNVELLLQGCSSSFCETDRVENKIVTAI